MSSPEALKERFEAAVPCKSGIPKMPLERSSYTQKEMLKDSQGMAELLEQPVYNRAMDNSVTRDELNAKLESVEARMDGRLASIEAKIDGFIGRLEEKFGRMDDRMIRIENDLEGSKQDLKSLRTTIITTGIGSVLAIVFGVAAFNATVLSNMLASFESGKNTATALTQATEQMKQTQDQLKAIQERLDKQATK